MHSTASAILPVVVIATLLLASCSAAEPSEREDGPTRSSNPVEIGIVDWRTDVDLALRQSGETGKPVFILFQEVPGCAGCQEFGANVLSDELLVEAIESEFLPVVVYNNQGGEHQKQLQRFQEPAWNYQVVRFVDAEAKDLIPRKDRVWSRPALAARMVQSLQAAGRPVPNYLASMAVDQSSQARAAFAQHCFWTGEMRLGGIDGVQATEAGWLEGREVTLVHYDPDLLSLSDLVAQAQRAGCASKVFADAKSIAGLNGLPTGILDASYRPARQGDQKKQLERWTALHQVGSLTPMQKTKLNALRPVDQEAALSWLSPRQRAQLQP